MSKGPLPAAAACAIQSWSGFGPPIAASAAPETKRYTPTQAKQKNKRKQHHRAFGSFSLRYLLSVIFHVQLAVGHHLQQQQQQQNTQRRAKKQWVDREGDVCFLRMYVSLVRLTTLISFSRPLVAKKLRTRYSNLYHVS